MKMPDINKTVNATLQHFHTKNKRLAELIAVDEDDVNWRTADDGSELSHDWDVISWEYAGEETKERELNLNKYGR